MRFLFDLLFPPRCLSCGRWVGRGADIFCPSCLEAFPWASPVDHRLTEWSAGGIDPIDRIGALARYDGLLSDLIVRMKYRKEEKIGHRLGRWMASLVSPVRDYDLLLPVPLHPTRLRERGFNQSWLLAKWFAKGSLTRKDPFLLRRLRKTPPQTNLSRRERLENVRGAFVLTRPEQVEGKRVLLIDDVCTTGATLAECGRLLKKAGAASVEGMVLARVH